MSLTERVLARYLSAGWDNAINGEYFSLHWNRSKWHLEEMADGSKMPQSLSVTEKGPPMLVWELPQLGAILSKFDTPVARYGEPKPETLRRYMRFPFDASGEATRQTILNGCQEFIKEAIEGLQDDPFAAERFEKVILPQVQKKLVWKKVSR